MLLAEYPFLSVMETLLVVFFWVIWFWLLILVLGDLIRRVDIGGWAKAAWAIFVIILPFIGCLIYLITQSSGMGERRAREEQAQEAQFGPNGGPATAGSSPATEIEKAKQLLDAGVISQAEFDDLKRKALSAT